jgi:hypothetical protein
VQTKATPVPPTMQFTVKIDEARGGHHAAP